MSNIANSLIYDQILEDEGFINDEWNKFDATTKIEILQKAGVDLMSEWSKQSSSMEEND